ncbi:ribonuclease HI family protein [Delftia sp. PS-11]|uniref:ribonuclease HI family protein n=1 Tax=Delftia sp. PS-11 TaxID=2767222 RepID=UPI0024589304|nr:ribonuclease HI family protein [Delftia sp. PS-11]KAJ8744263.1 ribonuclease HI family protein [Delftia sp. PS-11]
MQRSKNARSPRQYDPNAWNVHIDGSAMPNPGPMAIGVLITAPDGSRHQLSQALQATGCNNEAELRALMAALHKLRELQADRLDIFTDSSILVEQLAQPAPRPIVRLAALFDATRTAMSMFGQVRLHWVPRHRNADADALARAAFNQTT